MDQIVNPRPDPAAADVASSSGSVGLTLRCFYHTLRISVPTVFDAAIARLSPQACDARLRDWAETLIRITRTGLTVTGHEHIPDTACIVMSNHQSLSDIPVLYAALPESLRMRMVAKEELFRIPIWGRAMRLAGFIPINRGNRAHAIASLERAQQAMAGGTYIWIAPEGTRSRNQKLGTLKKGGFILARDVGVPIAPLCISGSHAVMPPQGWRLHRDNTVRIHFGPVIATADRPIEDVMQDVAAAIDPERVFASQPAAGGS